MAGAGHVPRRDVAPTRAASSAVHPTAVLQGRVRLADGCTVGPLAVLCGPVSLGRDCAVDALAVVAGPAAFAAGNRIHPFAVLGGPPQDRKYAGERTRLVVGAGNVFREHVTVHRGTRNGGGTTRIGGNCLFMAGVHVAHDCRIGDGVQIANGVSLGGHVTVESHAIIGGHAAVAPFVRVGHGAMVAGGAMVDRDVPPDCIVRGDRAAVVSLNVVGLRRRGVPARSIAALRALVSNGKQ